ncbi:unnamed protein product [Bursaphelenchus okinawaensis]|uniref:Mos1 transposase HTH domain-containing protein n=1 Tax=Bursaphelenchus okinawaensis TaxID=465554 RepID=A0A811LFN8_9BILA|nr:unnamed protein product [Bursaphelenchus okinawaensis]CAG9121578.1 unnamed protein product [Bursaphelenchus okinawaensis]
MEKSRLRVIIWNEFKRGNTAAETFRIINENEGKNVVSYSTVTRWFAKFRVDDEKLEDKPRAGRPSNLDKDALRRKIEDDPHITIRELEELLNCGKSTIGDHLKAMGMVKKLDKWVPHNLTDLQKAKRRCASEKLLQRCKNEEFLDRIVNIDEKWISFNNTRRSTSWCKHGEAPKHVPKPELHEKKLMVTVWWCSSGVIQYDFMKPGQSITADTYCAQIDKLRHNLPTMVRRRGPIILQDNARPHAAKKTVAKFRELGYELSDVSDDAEKTNIQSRRSLSSFWSSHLKPIMSNPAMRRIAITNMIMFVLIVQLLATLVALIIIAIAFHYEEVRNNEVALPCVYTWSQWTACSATCRSPGKPFPTKERQVNKTNVVRARGQLHDISPCPKDVARLKEQAPCNIAYCPIPISTFNFSQKSYNSKAYGGDIKIRLLPQANQMIFMDDIPYKKAQ